MAENKLARNKEWLYDEYITKQQTRRQISEKANCNRRTISRWLTRHDIPKRSWRREDNRNWKGGKYMSYGYVFILNREHPRAYKNGYVIEHLLVWEKFHKKSLPRGWIIHHVNGIKDDNRIENLEAMPDKKHRRLVSMYRKRILELEKELFEARLGVMK